MSKRALRGGSASPIAWVLKEQSGCPQRVKTRKRPPIALHAIRAFYELHPYPAPIASLEQRLDRYRDPQRRRAQSLLLWPLEKPRPDRTILVAGCGTSQAARHALMEPDARVTAIDVSETSLRHTRDLQQQARHPKLAAPPASQSSGSGSLARPSTRLFAQACFIT